MIGTKVLLSVFVCTNLGADDLGRAPGICVASSSGSAVEHCFLVPTRS